MNQRLIDILKFLVFLSIGLGILYFVYNSQNAAFQEQCRLDNIPASECSLTDKLISDFKSVNYWWILAVLAAFMISNVSRALRWNMLIYPLDYRPKAANTFFATMIGYFANLGLPRMGEVIRAGTITRYEKIPLEKVMGTVVVDRVMDVICLLVVIGLTFLLEFDRLWGYLSVNAQLGNKASFFTSPIFLGAISFFVFIIILFYIFRKSILESALFKKIKNLVLGFWEGIKTIAKLDNVALFLFHTIVIWLMYYLMTYLAFMSFAPTAHLGLSAALLVFTFGALGIVIPSPGGMGTYHFLVIAALTLYGISGDDAFSLANVLFFSVNMFCNIFFGIVGLIVLPIINKNYIPKLPATST